VKIANKSDLQIMQVLIQARLDVTVTKVCRECGMSRATFYK